MALKKYCLPLFIAFLAFGCATYDTKYADRSQAEDISEQKEVLHTFYLIGDAGLSPMGGMNPALKAFKERLDQADRNSTAIFLGDNIYPAGLPNPKDSTLAYRLAKNHLDAQLRTLENFKGRPLFIPGNHDWYTEGLVGLKRQEEYVERQLEQKDPFLPENGCPIERIEIGDDLAIIVLDTEWYLTNWDKRPGINDKCDIKSRDLFWLELEDAITDYRQRTTLIAMHHPMFSYGSHGGQYSLKKQFYPKKMAIPLPVLGTVINTLRKTAGASIEDMQNKRYRELKKRLITLAQYSERVILASGHEHSLQYIVEDNTPQIVSGSGAKTGETRLLNGSQFSTGRRGYATLKVYTDGSSRLRFFGPDDSGSEEFLFTSAVLSPDRNPVTGQYPDTFPETVEASIYTEEETDKSGFYKAIWGERYREYYATKITAPTVDLDTLYGGLEAVNRGGGHQSKSLRLRHADGREFVMRALRKVPDLYIQAMVFPDQYIIDDLQDTYTIELLQDFYTGAHPYAPFVTGPMSDAVGLLHTNPVLYYVPKQKALEEFNEDYGDALYMIEEHAGDGHGNLASFGYSEELKGTDSMLDDLREDEKYVVDRAGYLRARLFDMVIGDWDRHVDQWRWAEFKDSIPDKILYRPVPRDRDMVFSNYGDGILMEIATRIVPSLRLMEGYHAEIRNVRGFNSSPKTYVLDLAMLSEMTLEQWLEEARFIQENLTSEVIDKAFEQFPEEVRDETTVDIKRKLLARIDAIALTASEYHGVLNKYATVVGTDKDDWFVIERKESGDTEISAFRIIDGKKRKRFFHKVFDPGITKEIWVYGLDDDDRFEVRGEAAGRIKIRLVGGQNHDIYDISNGSKVAVYDYKSGENTFDGKGRFKLKRTDDYEVNTYLPMDMRKSSNLILPTIGFNPDDGIKIGVTDVFTYNGFRKNPFTQQHRLNASFYFATSGFELGYEGEFAHVFENLNLALAARFTSPNYAVNFFGLGNNTPNFDDDLDFDYNRVKLETIRFSPSLVWRGQLGAKVQMGVSYETLEVEETNDRFINTYADQNNLDSRNSFFGVNARYSYENYDNKGFPTLGMSTSLEGGYKANTEGDRSFGYIIPALSFDYKLIPSGRLVLATKWKAQFNLGEGYEFYQAANLGGNDGLRGFRNQRFSGQKSYYQNTDIRYSLNKIRTGILPTALGMYVGFDYGRVWQPGNPSNRWHTSYGLGFFANAADILSFRTALFLSDDGPRFAFGLGFGF